MLALPERGGRALDVRPAKGDALLFRNVRAPVRGCAAAAHAPAGGYGAAAACEEDVYRMEVDPRSVHAGRRVRSGTKTILTKWFHPVPFPDGLPPPPNAKAKAEAAAAARAPSSS